MDYLNLHTSTIDSEAFQDATRAQQAVFIAVLRYCAGQENGGVIKACRDWSDAKWQRVVRVSQKEILAVCGLWRFEANDLHVAFYPITSERQLKAMSEGGQKGAFRRWKKEPNNPPNSPPIGGADAKRNGTETESGSEREGDAPPEVPSLQEVRDWALGGVGVDPDYAEQKYHALNETNGWVKNGQLIRWRERLLRFWTEDREAWLKNKKRARVETDPDVPTLPNKVVPSLNALRA